MSKTYHLRPFLCIDNIDMESKIHHRRVEQTTKAFHATWGYFHVLSESLTPKAEADEMSLEHFLTAMSWRLNVTMKKMLNIVFIFTWLTRECIHVDWNILSELSIQVLMATGDGMELVRNVL